MFATLAQSAPRVRCNDVLAAPPDAGLPLLVFVQNAFQLNIVPLPM